MTWEIALGIFALVGFIITLGSIIFKLSSIMTKLQTMIESLQDIINELKKTNAEEHKEFRDKMEENERRITALEFLLHPQT